LGQLRQRRPFGDKQLKQPVDVAHPLAHDHAELSEVRSDGADQAAALSDQKVAGSVEQENGLLVGALDRHELHGGPLHRFTDRLGIRHVVLLALDVGGA
jgi:hypothetical protein